MTSTLPPGAASIGPALANAASARRSIRRPLLIAAGTFILVSGLLTAFTLQYLRTQSMADAARLTASFAQVIEEQTSRTLQTVDQRLELAASSLARLDANGARDEEAVRALLHDQIEEQPFVRGLLVLDKQGRIVHSSEPGSMGGSRADRDYFQIYQTRPQTGFFVGVPLRSPTNGHWLLSAARPLRDAEGAPAGVIVAAIEGAYLDRLWSGVAVGANGAISLLRDDGMLLMRSPIDGAKLGQRFTDLMITRQPADTRSAGTFSRTSTIDGESRVFAYRALAARPALKIVVGQSYDLVLAPWRQLALVVCVVWTAGALAVVVLCLFLSRSWHQRVRSDASGERMAERLGMATEAAGIGVWDWDLGADQWYATPTYFTMLGHPARPGNSTSAQSLEDVHPQDLPMVAARIRAALASSAVPYQYEARLRHADGHYRWIQVAGRVLARDAHGQAMRLFGANIDITERRQAEEALRQSEQHLRNLIDGLDASMMLGLMALDGTVLEMSRNALQLSQLQPRDVLGRHLEQTYWFAHSAPLQAQLREAIVHGCRGQSSRFDVLSRVGDGRFLTLDFSLHPLRNAAGEVVFLVPSASDITQRKQAEEELRRADAELRVLNRTLEVMVECNQVLVRASDEQGLLEEMCRIFVERGGHRMAWVGLTQFDEACGIEVAAVRGQNSEMAHLNVNWQPTGVGLGPAGTAIRTGRAVLTPDMREGPAYQPWRSEVQALGLRSAIALPLGNGVPALGVLNIYSAEPDRFHDEEMRLLTELANNLAYGIQSLRADERRRDAETAQAESERRYRQLVDQSPYAIGVMQDGFLVMANPAALRLFGATAPEQLLGRSLAQVVASEHLEVARARMRLIARGESHSYPVEARYRRIDGSLVEVEASAAPMLYQDRAAVQVIALDISKRKQAEEALRESKRLLQSLGRRVLAAQETERRRVAHELHDELGQALTALKINMQSPQRFATRPQAELDAENMHMVEDALQQVRRLALALRPSMLDDLGLVPALRWMAEQTAVRNAMEVRLYPDLPPVRLAAEIETACFRIAQEALTNISRYAHARNVDIALYREEDSLVLSVHDDGRGFNVEAMRQRAASGTSIGVLGMQERATLIGGELDIESSPGRGSTVRLRCPWHLLGEAV